MDNKLNKLFFDACKTGDVKFVKTHLNNKLLNINYCSGSFNCLGIALKNDHLHVAKLLLSTGRVHIDTLPNVVGSDWVAPVNKSLNRAFSGVYVNEKSKKLRHHNYYSYSYMNPNKQVSKAYIGWYEAPQRTYDITIDGGIYMNDHDEKGGVINDDISREFDFNSIDIHQDNDIFLSLPLDIFNNIFEFLNIFEIVFKISKVCALFNYIIMHKPLYFLKYLTLLPNQYLQNFHSVHGNFQNSITNEMFLHFLQTYGKSLEGIEYSNMKNTYLNVSESCYYKPFESIKRLDLSKQIDCTKIIVKSCPILQSLNLEFIELSIPELSKFSKLRKLKIRGCKLFGRYDNKCSLYNKTLKKITLLANVIHDNALDSERNFSIATPALTYIHINDYNPSFNYSFKIEHWKDVKTIDLNIGRSHQGVTRNLKLFDIIPKLCGLKNLTYRNCVLKKNYFSSFKSSKNITKMIISNVIVNEERKLLDLGLRKIEWPHMDTLEIKGLVLCSTSIEGITRACVNLKHLKIIEKFIGGERFRILNTENITTILECLKYLQSLHLRTISKLQFVPIITNIFLLAKKNLTNVNIGFGGQQHRGRFIRGDRNFQNEFLKVLNIMNKNAEKCDRIFPSKRAKMNKLVKEFNERSFRDFSISYIENELDMKKFGPSQYSKNGLISSEKKMTYFCVTCKNEVIPTANDIDDGNYLLTCKCGSNIVDRNDVKNGKSHRSIEHINYICSCLFCGMNVPILNMSNHVKLHDEKTYTIMNVKKNLKGTYKETGVYKMHSHFINKMEIALPFKSAHIEDICKESYCIQCQKKVHMKCDCISHTHKGRPIDGIDYKVICQFCKDTIWISKYQNHLEVHNKNIEVSTNKLLSYKCPLGCGHFKINIKNSRGALINHIESCSMNIIICHSCKKEMKYYEYQDHICKDTAINFFFPNLKGIGNQGMEDMLRKIEGRKMIYEFRKRNQDFETEKFFKKKKMKKVFVTMEIEKFNQIYRNEATLLHQETGARVYLL